MTGEQLAEIEVRARVGQCGIDMLRADLVWTVAEIRRLWKRERELLAANNVELEKRRKAESYIQDAQMAAIEAQVIVSKTLVQLAEAHRDLEELRAREHARAMAAKQRSEQQGLPGAMQEPPEQSAPLRVGAAEPPPSGRSAAELSQDAPQRAAGETVGARERTDGRLHLGENLHA